MFLRARERLPLIAPPLESVLSVGQLLLLPCLLVFAEVGLLNFYLGARSIVRMNWMLTGGVIGLFTVHVLLVRLPVVQGRLETIVAKLKRAAVLSCPRVSTSVRGLARRPACWFIPAAYQQPLFRYDGQQEVVNQIVHRLASDDENNFKFLYIEGESGQGKTRTIFLLVHAILKHPKLSDLANRTFLYDLAGGAATGAALCRRLDTIDHQDALVVVDNLHHIEPALLRVLTHKLLDTPSRNTERLVVLLGQPSHAWRVRPTAEVRLLSSARKHSAYFVLKGVSSRSLAEQLLGLTRGKVWATIFAPSPTGAATLLQLYCAQAIASKRLHQLPQLRELVELLEGVPSVDGTRSKPMLVRFVAIVTALAMYRGNFTIHDFWSASWALAEGRSWGLRLATCLGMCALLRRMSRLGFTPRLTTPRSQIVLHEALAEHCKDRLAANELFATSFFAGVQWRLSNLELDDPMVRWMLFAEVRDAVALERLFDQALLRGTLAPMVRCLDRNWAGVKHSPAVSYQYALLLDQVGRFSESRRVFDHVEAHDPMGSVLADRVQLARIEAEHGAGSEAILARVLQRGDTLNTIAAEYWKIHLDAHRGIFRPLELMRLAEGMGRRVLLEEMEMSHFLLHSASRIFFDAHRHIYLSGEQIQERLARLQQLPLETALRRQFPQFSGFAILYREAHLLAHDAIPNLVFFGLRPDLGVLNVKDLDTGNITARFLVEMARDAYARAKDEFALYGDREYLYVQADLLNLEMLIDDPDMEAIRLKLIDYEAFVRKTGFVDIQSYPCFYFFRWHMLQYFRWMERGDERYALGEADINFERARDWLAKGFAFDESSGNAYGLWRIRFFRALLSGISSGDAPDMITSLRECAREADSLGYHRDASLVHGVLRQSKVTPLDVRRMALYFPFVHQ